MIAALHLSKAPAIRRTSEWGGLRCATWNEGLERQRSDLRSRTDASRVPGDATLMPGQRQVPVTSGAYHAPATPSAGRPSRRIPPSVALRCETHSDRM